MFTLVHVSCEHVACDCLMSRTAGRGLHGKRGCYIFKHVLLLLQQPKHCDGPQGTHTIMCQYQHSVLLLDVHIAMVECLVAVHDGTHLMQCCHAN